MVNVADFKRVMTMTSPLKATVSSTTTSPQRLRYMLCSSQWEQLLSLWAALFLLSCSKSDLFVRSATYVISDPKENPFQFSFFFRVSL